MILLPESNLIDLNYAKATLLRTLSEEEDFWKQKSGVKRLHDGDRNTFHKSTVDKISHKTIIRINKADGTWLTEF